MGIDLTSAVPLGLGLGNYGNGWIACLMVLLPPFFNMTDEGISLCLNSFAT
jgi:hypothetical protein